MVRSYTCLIVEGANTLMLLTLNYILVVKDCFLRYG
jgi:hypothetical protein